MSEPVDNQPKDEIEGKDEGEGAPGVGGSQGNSSVRSKCRLHLLASVALQTMQCLDSDKHPLPSF
jgi:hypothetical protein